MRVAQTRKVPASVVPGSAVPPSAARSSAGSLRTQHARISRAGVGAWWVPGAGRASCLGVLASAGQGVQGSRGRSWEARLGRASARNHLLLHSITATRCSCCSSRSLADQARAQADHLEEGMNLRKRASWRSACGMRHGVRVRGGRSAGIAGLGGAHASGRGKRRAAHLHQVQTSKRLE